MAKLNSKIVVKQINSYKRQLDEVVENSSDFRQLHSDIIRFFKIVCDTKAEYKDMTRYPQDICHIEFCDPDGKIFYRSQTCSEEKLIESRNELALKLQVKLMELYEEYQLRNKLEETNVYNYKEEIKSIKTGLKKIQDEVLKLKEELSKLRRQ